MKQYLEVVLNSLFALLVCAFIWSTFSLTTSAKLVPFFVLSATALLILLKFAVVLYAADPAVGTNKVGTNKQALHDNQGVQGVVPRQILPGADKRALVQDLLWFVGAPISILVLGAVVGPLVYVFLFARLRARLNIATSTLLVIVVVVVLWAGAQVAWTDQWYMGVFAWLMEIVSGS